MHSRSSVSRRQALPVRRRLSSFSTATLPGLVALFGGSCNEPAGTGNQPPVVTIVSPAPGSSYRGGDLVAIQATASDDRDGVIGASRMEWWAVLHHLTHTHPAITPQAGNAGTLTVPRTGHPETDVFYRVHVRAVDANGLADTTFVDIAPRIVTLTLATVPAGLQVLVDDQPRATPLSIASIVGMERDLGVPPGQTLNGVEFEFASWSHGGAESQTYTTPEQDVALTVLLREAGVANVPPGIALMSPINGSVVTAGSTVTLQATATDSDGSITLVEFFEGSTRLGADSIAPFAFEWAPNGTGSRILTARAVDNHGAYATSPTVTVTVQAAGGGDVLAPVATLTSPDAGSLNLTGTVPLTAAATDNIGVTQVQFDVDGVPVGVDDSAPFEASIAATASYASGAHVIRARARDAAGNWSDWSANVVTFGGDVALPQGFMRAPYVTGFGDVLTAAAVTPDGRVFVAEKSGRLRVIKDGQLLVTPFVALEVLDGGERGLLGVALHPDFAKNSYVYLYYTTAVGGAHNRISRLVASGDVAAAGTETILAELPPLSDASKHNGGAMHFGVDGKLYVAVGDDGDGSNAPSLATPFGKILRFNSDGSIPTDNPFLAQTTGVNRSIWARGLRNPFTFAIEAGTGRMHINDVGAATWEEVNLGRAGADFGWPATEGPTSNPAYDSPILAYRHSDSPTLFDGFAVVGAAFYHPSAPLLGDRYVGQYFFADYVNGWIYTMDVANGNAAYAFARLDGFPTGLYVGPDGALYVLIGTRIDRISR